MKIVIGDEVRVHYHRPERTMSFVEGVVRRVDVTTLRGRMFVIDVTYEVILDREQRIGRGYRNYVLYECEEDFPGRVRVLSPAAERAAPARPASSPATTQENDRERFLVEIERLATQRTSNVIPLPLGRRKSGV